MPYKKPQPKKKAKPAPKRGKMGKKSPAQLASEKKRRLAPIKGKPRKKIKVTKPPPREWTPPKKSAGMAKRKKSKWSKGKGQRA